MRTSITSEPWLLLALSVSVASVPACKDDKGTYVPPGGGPQDLDGDGYDEEVDCDDSDPAVHPEAVEVCGDGIDNDCDGAPDPECITDADGDGYPAEVDCNDGDPSVHPDAVETCDDSIDNDCNGIATECVLPSMLYRPTNAGPLDSYGTAVFADRYVFGDPGVGGMDAIGDGRFSVFEGISSGPYDELGAQSIALGELGAVGGFGRTIVVDDDYLCVGADDYDPEPGIVDGGKVWCFDDATIRDSQGTIDPAQAIMTVSGAEADARIRVVGRADVDGDGSPELLVASSDGLHVDFLFFGGAWEGDIVSPREISYTMGQCEGSVSSWCGYGVALSDDAVATSGPGGPSDSIWIHRLPTYNGAEPDGVYEIDRGETDPIAAVETTGGFAVASSTLHRVDFISDFGALLAVLDGPGDELFGSWVDTMPDVHGHELLLVGAPAMVHEGLPVGGVYVFDLTEHGVPTDSAQAAWKLIPTSDFTGCGVRARGDVVVLELPYYDRLHTLATSTCPGSGALGYSISNLVPPPPTPLPGDITEVGPSSYAIRRQLIDVYTSSLPWVLSLAETEAVEVEGAIAGWRLRGIEPGSPLHQAGLRQGDIVRGVDDMALTSSEAVMQAATERLDANQVTLRIRRNGVNGTLHYFVVD